MNNLLEHCKQLWNKASLVQRIILLGSVLALAAGSIAVFGWASKPKMALLFGQLTSDDAARIVEKLDENDVTYQLKNSGTSIYVPAEQVPHLRMTLSQEGLPTGGAHGMELLEAPSYGESPEVTKERIRRAMEGELARSICVMEGITACRVHIVPSERTLFGTSDDRQAKASVTVSLEPGAVLSSRNVQAIVHLVAASVRGLSPQNVSLVDNRGTPLSGDGPDDATAKASNYLELKTQRERLLIKKVENILEPIFGKDNYRVELALDLDNILETTEKHTFDPNQKAPVSEELETMKSEGGRVASVLPGGTNGRAARLARAPGSEQQMKERIKYAYPVTRTKEEKASYDKRSVAVSALVNLAAATPRENGSKLTVDEVRTMIRGAINATDTDVIEVSDVAFVAPIGQGLGGDGETTMEFYLELAKRLSLGLLVVGALIALKIFTRDKSKKAEKQKALEASTAGALEGGSGQLPSGQTGQIEGYNREGHLLEAGGIEDALSQARENEEDEDDDLFGIDMLDEDAPMSKRLRVAMRKNPERVKQLFRAWVQSEESG